MTKRFFPFVLSSNNQNPAFRLLNPTAVALPMLTVGDDPVPIDQQLADAFNANNAIMAYVNGITNTNLPSLTQAPKWYVTFMSNFSDAKTHAGLWTNSIASGLVDIPTGIASYVFTFNINMININSALTVLQQNPSDQEAQQALKAGLQALLAGFSTQLTNVSDFQKLIDNFTNNLTSDAAMMQTAVTDAQNTVGYDQGQVTALLADINDLQNQINTWQKVATGAGIGAGVAFFSGCVIAIFTFGAGLAFGIMGAAAGIALLIAADVEIGKLTAKIAGDQGTMSELNQQITLLNAMMQQLNSLITLAKAASQQIQLVNEAWQALEQDITTVLNDIEKAQGDLTSLNLPALQNDLNSADTDWLALRSFCLTIAGIKYARATPATVNLPTAQQSIAA